MSSKPRESAELSGTPEATPPGGSSEQAEVRGGLWSRSFLALVATQFLVALNDNMFRWLVVPVGKDLLRTAEGGSGEAASALALSIGLACFVLPFVVLAAPAGYLADRFSKRKVMIGCKVAEIVIMALGMASVLAGNFYLMFVVLFLMGAQSALFSPSKYGSIPEIVRTDHISSANGIIGMTTMVAIILGTVAGNYLYAWTTPAAGTLATGQSVMPGHHQWWISATALIGVAVLGWIVSLFIGRLRPANPARRFPINPAGQTIQDLRALISKRALLLAALGSAYYWSLGALSQVNVDRFAEFELLVQQEYVGPLLAALTLGIGAGALMAGIWSAGKVELGLVPLGAAGIAVAAMLLWTVPQGVENTISSGYHWTCFWLFALGCTAGLYDIPLMAFLQHRSPKKSRGAILAANNFVACSGMLLAAGVFWFLTKVLALSAREIFLLAGVLTVPVFFVILYLVSTQTVRFLVERLVRILYRVRVRGLEHVPEEGGALLVPNHVTWIDGVLLLLFSPRPVRMIAHADYVSGRILGRWARDLGVIPIGPSRGSVVRAIRTAREALRQGDLVCIFPEGGLSRTGQIQSFNPGFLTILKETGVPVIPVHLGGLWGSIFSFEGGKFFWKWPRRWPYPVSVLFGRPIRNASQVQPVRLAVQELGAEAMESQSSARMIPVRSFLRMCRRSMRRSKLADSTEDDLTGAGLLTRALVLRRLIRREVLDRDEKHVGILLPSSVAGAVTNAAVALDRRVAVNLNYTVSSEVLNDCIRQAGLRHVLTSRKVMERFNFDIECDLVYLEDFKDKITRADKLTAACQAWLWPIALLERWLGLTRVDPEDLLTIMFTSGSTGRPKGVMLTHHNVSSNVAAFNQIVHLKGDDVLIGILPFFHSFGFTTTMWSVLMLEPKGAYHFTPLEPRQIGKLCRRHRGTLLIGTPTFLRSYLKRCAPEDFASLNAVLTGAEKLPSKLADAFEARFGVRPVEGYGTTELSPVVSVNVPASRVVDDSRPACKEGTVGQPLPGICAKIVDLETGEDLPTDQPGMLLIKGHNVMQGYLNQPETTAEVIRDGWYVTGDVALIDGDGFIRITGRQSRFSKIGGEMVPHIHIEETLEQVLGLDEDEVRLAVMAVPDARKGERLVVLHTGLGKPPEEVCRDLVVAGLPPIWIPSADSFSQVAEIPLLGTGKPDLKRLKELAVEKFPPRE